MQCIPIFRLVIKQGSISKLLRDMILKLRPRMLSCSIKKVIYLLRFCNLNSPCTRISTHIDVYEPSEDGYRLFMAKGDDTCFCLLSYGLFTPIIYSHPEDEVGQNKIKNLHRKFI